MTVVKEYKKAVDRDVLFSDGTSRRLSDLWIKKPLLLVFLRHFG